MSDETTPPAPQDAVVEAAVEPPLTPKNAASTSNNVYVLDEEYGWLPGRILSTSTATTKAKTKTKTATVRVTFPNDDDNDDNPYAAPDEEDVEVNLSDYPTNSLPLQNVDEEGKLVEVPDMVDLAFLHEAAILYNLKHRHVRGVPYTRTGDIVIAVNPYQWIDGLYSSETQELYATKLIWSPVVSQNASGHQVDAKSTIDPHVYETSSLAYRGLACDAQNQSVLVSGESGAGKTETVKILMSHLAMVQHGFNPSSGSSSETDDDSTSDLMNSSSHNLIIKRVLDSNPLLEAFGNAKTSRNDNSSRFGKYIQLQFDCESPRIAALQGKRIPSATLAGSKCITYLLEKSRVVLHENLLERGYHIFYQLLAAPPEYKADVWRDEFAPTGPEDFKYLGETDTDTIEGMGDGEKWEMTVQALRTIGIEEETLRELMHAMCTVLQLGNLTFESIPENEFDEASRIADAGELEALADLMEMDAGDVEAALTIRTVTARNEIMKVPLNEVAAKDSTDAFAKEIYARCFDWLVRRINEATTAELNYEGGKKLKYGMIGLLDIFGFESFEVNRFEQLCINYANEKLQQKFTQDIFRSVQAEYEYEGIELGEVQFEDNADVLKIIEGRMGLISVLNEECVRPRGNDVSFVAKINAMNKENDILIQDNFFREYEFGIQHYAGPVVYDSTNFVKKNTDAMPKDLVDCAGKCGNGLIRSELLRKESISPPPPPKSSGGGRRPRGGNKPTLLRKQSSGSLVAETVSTKFKNQLSTLMANIGETRTRYIRCIKPNQEKLPLKMDQMSTVAQLRCAGVVAAVTISRSAFPNRLDHDVVLERFGCLESAAAALAPSEDSDEDEDTSKRRVERVLTILFERLECKKADGTPQSPFVCGKTRVYFRAGSLEYLESARLSALEDMAVLIQCVTRGYFARSLYVTWRESSIKLQSRVRIYHDRTEFLRAKRACILLQCWARCDMAHDQLRRKREFSKALMIQTFWRMLVATDWFYRARGAATKIQAAARGAHQRPVYRQLRLDAIEEAKIENQLKMLQKKLEEAEQARIDAEKRAAEQAEKAAAAASSSSSPPQTVVVYRDSEEKKTEATTQVSQAQAQLTAQQHSLIDESGKMLEYLRKEVFKLRSQNAQLRKDFDTLRENNQRLMDSNASAGASFAALNQHAKQLNRTNAKLMSDVQSQKQMVSKLHLAHMELKEELKMKQQTYISEVQSRLTYQKTMARMVEMIHSRCNDKNLVEDVLAMSEACDSDYMSGPTGRSPTPRGGGLASPARAASNRMYSPEQMAAQQHQQPASPDELTSAGESSISGKFLSFFGMGSPQANKPRPKLQTPNKENLSGLEVFSGNFAEM